MNRFKFYHGRVYGESEIWFENHIFRQNRLIS